MRNVREWNRWVALFLLSAILVLPQVGMAQSIEELGLERSCRAYILGDYASGEILESYRADEPMEIASLSKLLSYYVVKDAISQGTIKENDKVTITEGDIVTEGSSFKMKSGEVYMVSELIEAMLLVSANDATKALARYVSGTEENFVQAMTEKARVLGLDNARLYNATGLPNGEGHLQNSMTPKEVFTLIRSLIMDYPDVLAITQKPFLSQDDRSYLEPNTNPLVNTMEGIDGIKTGYTEKAGYCLAATGIRAGVEQETEAIRLIGIVMGTTGYEEREEAAQKLMTYGFENYEWKILGAKNTVLGNATFSKGQPYQAPYFAAESKSVLGRVGEAYETDVAFQQNKELPIPAGDIIGEVTYYRGNDEVYKTQVVVHEEITPAGMITLFHRTFNDQLKTFGSFFSELKL